jgi:hypothetical protein
MVSSTTIQISARTVTFLGAVALLGLGAVAVAMTLDPSDVLSLLGASPAHFHAW